MVAEGLANGVVSKEIEACRMTQAWVKAKAVLRSPQNRMVNRRVRRAGQAPQDRDP